MRYDMAQSTWDELEQEALLEVIRSGRYTMGDKVRAFESAFAAYFGSKFAIMVNSGSSANLLAAAICRYRSQRPIQLGDEVIVPALSWSTTFFPFTQNGMKLVFVDVDPNSFNMDLAAVEAAIGPRTRAICAVNVLGCPVNYDLLCELAEQRGLLLIEDNCEGMGAKWRSRYTGSFGAMGTFSTYFSHHISTMEGGLLVTDDEEYFQLGLSLRCHGWLRDLPQENHVHPKSGDPFEDSFRFALPGYNLRPLEMEGALGLLQLDKLATLLATRRLNAEYFSRLFGDKDWLAIQKTIGDSSWFGFGMVLRGPLAGKRRLVSQRLLAAGIESRPILSGNFTKNPVMKHLDTRVHGSLVGADRLDLDGLYVGNCGTDLSDNLDHLFDTFQHILQEISS